MSDPEMLYNTLSRIGEIASPQKNIYLENDKYSKPVYFAFRFAQVPDEDLIYGTLSKIINNFKGRLKWIMHSEGSQKNYTIEPYDFYLMRKKIYNDKLDVSLKNLFSEDDFRSIIDLALTDIKALCSLLDSKISSGVFGNISK